MASLQFLPSTTYQPPSPAQVRSRRRALNPILEDDDESVNGAVAAPSGRGPSSMDPAWLSPFSDHFPTPRAVNFMSVNVPSSPSSAESTSPNSTLAPWTRNSVASSATEIDDIYDVSDDEDSRRKRTPTYTQNPRRLSSDSLTRKAIRPSLIIPNSGGDRWTGLVAAKALTSPVPPTPPPKVPMSPAILSYLASTEIPSGSAPPSLDGSLDGSLTSEQMAAMSAPPTPDLGNDETDGDNWGGMVQLQPAAMETLHALAGNDVFDDQREQVIEISESPVREMVQSPPPHISSIRRHDSVVLSPAQQRAFEGLTRLEIPSPGGFFAGLNLAARHTWHLVPNSPADAPPPSSTTAEHFYKTPWSSAPVERIIEVPESMSDGMPTARPLIRHDHADETVRAAEPQADSPVDEIDNSYARKLQSSAASNVDRTQQWLTAQTEYLDSLVNPKEARDDDEALRRRDTIIHGKTTARAEAAAKLERKPSKKSVRFSELVKPDAQDPLPKVIAQESTYYRAFRAQHKRTQSQDLFVHRLPRFEAMQSQRVTFPEAHRNQLLGKYQLSVKPLSAKRRMSANVARGDELTFDTPEKIKKDKETEAAQQMSKAAWNLQATRALNGGRLIAAPVAKRLARLSRMGPTLEGVPRDRARILDLGGQATCDWAWNCALEYPNCKVYTVTTKAIRQASNSNIKGPANHRQVAVERLTRLPFKDNQFDLISARHISSILKENGENGSNEYDGCLAECMRILKPGGYLEFNVLDSEIVNAGPLGLAKSVEFGFSLRTRGYDPLPTQQWLARLARAGFVNTKRAWLFLPMAPAQAAPPPADAAAADAECLSGSTAAAAPITSLVGSWAWEKWMLKLQMESGMADDQLLRGVADVVEEGRHCGSGWRSLNGWTRKPLR